MKRLWTLYLRYKEIILYLIFGGLTTLTNIGAYAVFAKVFHMELMIANGFAGVCLIYNVPSCYSGVGYVSDVCDSKCT